MYPFIKISELDPFLKSLSCVLAVAHSLFNDLK